MGQSTKTNNQIRTLVILGDFVILNILFFICRDRLGFSCLYGIGLNPLMPLFVMNISMAVAQYFFSTVIHLRRAAPERVLRQVTLLVLLQGVVAYVMAELMSVSGGYPIPDVFSYLRFTGILYCFIILSRYLERWFLKRYRRMGGNTRNVIFVGSDPSMLSVYNYLVAEPSMGYRVQGYYSDVKMDECPEDLHYLGTLADLDSEMCVTQQRTIADEVYCCLPVTDRDTIRKVMRYCNNNVLHFYYIPVISQVFEGTFRQESVGDTTVFTNHLEPLMKPANKFIKRTFDILFSLVVLVFLAVLTPFIALIIKIQSPGPVFFRQARTGLNGRNFNCYKFRSMHVNKDADLIQATEHDPRKFAFGNIMRKSNIDELPQFFNVLIGDMSIVGPRPHMLHHTEVYRELIDTYMVRHFVKPGITGWAQVTGFRGETKELWQMKGRVKRDIWYIENWTIWLDLIIIWKTAKQIFVHDEMAY